MNILRILFGVIVAGAALTTFLAMVGTIALYRLITKDEPITWQDDYDACTAADRELLRPSFVPKRKAEYPRQTTADVLRFNADRAERKRGRRASQ